MAYEDIINAAAKEHGLDPSLLSRLVQQESGGDPTAVSPKGATGLTQLMPKTAQDLGVTDPTDPEQSIRGGAKYLAAMRKMFGDDSKALAAYNWGPGNVAKHLAENKGELVHEKLPAETRQYIQAVAHGFQPDQASSFIPDEPSKTKKNAVTDAGPVDIKAHQQRALDAMVGQNPTMSAALRMLGIMDEEGKGDPIGTALLPITAMVGGPLATPGRMVGRVIAKAAIPQISEHASRVSAHNIVPGLLKRAALFGARKAVAPAAEVATGAGIGAGLGQAVETGLDMAGVPNEGEGAARGALGGAVGQAGDMAVNQVLRLLGKVGIGPGGRLSVAEEAAIPKITGRMPRTAATPPGDLPPLSPEGMAERQKTLQLVTKADRGINQAQSNLDAQGKAIASGEARIGNIEGQVRNSLVEQQSANEQSWQKTMREATKRGEAEKAARDAAEKAKVEGDQVAMEQFTKRAEEMAKSRADAEFRGVTSKVFAQPVDDFRTLHDLLIRREGYEFASAQYGSHLDVIAQSVPKITLPTHGGGTVTIPTKQAINRLSQLGHNTFGDHVKADNVDAALKAYENLRKNIMAQLPEGGIRELFVNAQKLYAQRMGLRGLVRDVPGVMSGNEVNIEVARKALGTQKSSNKLEKRIGKDAMDELIDLFGAATGKGPDILSNIMPGGA